MRVAFVLRSAEVQPLFRDLCGRVVVSKTDTMMRLSFLTPPNPSYGSSAADLPLFGPFEWTLGLVPCAPSLLLVHSFEPLDMIHKTPLLIPFQHFAWSELSG